MSEINERHKPSPDWMMWHPMCGVRPDVPEITFTEDEALQIVGVVTYCVKWFV